MSDAEKLEWKAQLDVLLALVAAEYTEENLKLRRYGSIVDIRVEYDRIMYLNKLTRNAFSSDAIRAHFPSGTWEKMLEVTEVARYYMDKDIIARTILKEGAAGFKGDYNAVAQVIINRYNQSIGAASGGDIKHKYWYAVSPETISKLEGLLGEDTLQDTMPYMYYFGQGADGKYHTYTFAGLVMASGQFTGLTGEDNLALAPYTTGPTWAKDIEDIDWAYAAAQKVVDGITANKELAALGFTQFRSPAVVKYYPNGQYIIVTSEDDNGKVTKTKYEDGQWYRNLKWDEDSEVFVPKGNYYIGEGTVLP